MFKEIIEFNDKAFDLVKEMSGNLLTRSKHDYHFKIISETRVEIVYPFIIYLGEEDEDYDDLAEKITEALRSLPVSGFKVYASWKVGEDAETNDITVQLVWDNE